MDSKTSIQELFAALIKPDVVSLNAPYHIMKASWFQTPLGPMIAMGDEVNLYLLEFFDRKNILREIEKFIARTRATIIAGTSFPLQKIEHELSLYFSGKLTEFQTPLAYVGSAFQEQIWRELSKIPHGKTLSYIEIAKAIKQPTASRAVARANSTNHIAIVIPCHRVINKNGDLGGYAGGIKRKEWLLKLEGRRYSLEDI